MAIIVSDKYPGRSNPPSIDYPLGSIKDQSAPGAKDGTPLKADWANDHEGFFQGLLKAANITANGNVDTAESSQYLDALKQVIEDESPVTQFATQAEFDAHTSKDKAASPFVMQPSINGNATLTASSNAIAMTGIVPAIGLDKGDVIQIKIASPAYDKLHTVESITNDGQIVVNYEHCGSRGNGALKLPDYTGSLIIKRVAKWYNSPPGLGQAWVDLTSLRVKGVVYPHPYSNLRVISINLAIRLYAPNLTAKSKVIDGSSDIFFPQSDPNGNGNTSTAASIQPMIVSDYSYVSVAGTSDAIYTWGEMR